jgi:hypothetical protein
MGAIVGCYAVVVTEAGGRVSDVKGRELLRTR